MEAFKSQVVFERTGNIALMGRGQLSDGSYWSQSDISTITLKVFRNRDGEQINADAGDSLVIADTIFNATRTTDPVSGETIWTEDSAGFNFMTRIPGSYLSNGGDEFIFEVQIVPVGGTAEDDSLWGLFVIPTRGLYSV